ncbi:MAG: hypothetical protein ACERKV_01155 [Clostridiaceae bacterium]
MKNPINEWSFEFVQELRKKSSCIGKSISYTFTNSDRQKAIEKLQILYPKGRVNPSYADRILYLSELY